MVLQLPDIEVSCGANLAGLNQIKVIPVSQVVSIPEAENDVIPSGLVLIPGATMSQLNFPEGAASFSEKEVNSDHGSYYKLMLEVFIPKDSPAIAKWSGALSKVKWCILAYEDNNGQAKIIGDMEFPMRFSSELIVDKNFNGKNGYTFTFTGENLNKAYFYGAYANGEENAEILMVDWDPNDWSLQDWN